MSVVIRATRVVDDPRRLDLLDPGERERASRRRDPHPFITAHALLRRLIADETGTTASTLEFEKRCTTCGTDRHGKPHVAGMPEIHVSVSYGATLAVAALTRLGEVGVDVEDFESTDFDGFAAVTLDASEAEALAHLSDDDLLAARARLWARKEAILKATGHGLVVDPSQVVVTAPDAPPALLAWRAQQHPPGPTQVADVDLGVPDHRAAVAVLTQEPITLELHHD